MSASYFARKRTGLTTKRAVVCRDLVDDDQVVLAQGVAGRDQIDDQIGEADQRREFDRAVQLDELHRQVALGEKGFRRSLEFRRHAQERRQRRALVIAVDRAAPATTRRQ